MNLLVIPIQSFSDIVTNSSSEVFITTTELTEEQVKTILSEVTYGFQDPFKFSLKEYRKHKAMYPEECGGYGTYYGVAETEFIDLEDKKDLNFYRLRELRYELDHYYHKNDYSLAIKLFSYLKKEYNIDLEGERVYFYLDKLTQEAFEGCIKFLEEYEKEGNPLPDWWYPEEKETLQYLDGKIMVLSDSDNTIPYDTFDVIIDLLGGYHIHLG